ncbi:carbamoyltransferase [bacterium]|nr:carbamoyltransferase [candidate division CSSED10-310 bacterium]
MTTGSGAVPFKAPEDRRFLALHAGHDSNVAVVDGLGTVRFAVSEERLNRIKQYPGFPRLGLEMAMAKFPEGFDALYTVRMPRMARILREACFLANSLRKGLTHPRGLGMAGVYLGKLKGRTLETEDHGAWVSLAERLPLINIEHHLAHAASAFYPSGFEKAYVMTLDGEGDSLSGGFYWADEKGLKRYRSFYYNEVTCGRDYEKVTAMLGFHPLRHPGKITGLAAYGKYNQACIEKLRQYLKNTWRRRPDRRHLTHHAYQVISDEGRRELQRIRRELFKDFPDEDMAYAIQDILEERVLDLLEANTDYRRGSIVLAGGVFANVKLNRRIKDLGFQNIFIHPAMTDQGLSVGAVLYHLGEVGKLASIPYQDVFFGPSFSNDALREALLSAGLTFETMDRPHERVAELLLAGRVVALFQGAMEYGPRALGHRSILYHTQDPTVNDWLNKRLQRTEFMPFAPVTLAEEADRCYLDMDGARYAAKFMTITFDCTEWMQRTSPAVVHVDGTARPQLIGRDDDPYYYGILSHYHRISGIPSLINTSFNMHEEPIVCTPEDAIRAFLRGHLDYLALGPYLVEHTETPVRRS